MLRADLIAALKIVENGSQENFRSASYDISISKIITPDGDEVDSYKLPPMGIVEVISKELFRIPPKICCLAHVKTSLCNEGLLTLNTGLVDPGWNGRLSSFILNFGKDNRLLLAGDVFLRITFHELSSPADPDYFGSLPERDATDHSYIAERKRNMVGKFSPEFLNLQRIIDKSVAATFEKYRQLLLVYVPIAAIVLAALTFFLNFGILSLVQKWVQPNDAAKAELLRHSLEQQEEAGRRTEKEFSVKLDSLEQEIKRIRSQMPGNNAK
jgi:deoxycytidine triphosphate deaminase